MTTWGRYCILYSMRSLWQRKVTFWNPCASTILHRRKTQFKNFLKSLYKSLNEVCSSILAPELSNLLRIHKWVFVFYWAFYPQYRKDALPRSTERWKVVNGPHNMRRSQEPTRTVLLRPSTCTLLVQWKFQWKEPRQGQGTSLHHRAIWVAWAYWHNLQFNG